MPLLGEPLIALEDDVFEEVGGPGMDVIVGRAEAAGVALGLERVHGRDHAGVHPHRILDLGDVDRGREQRLEAGLVAVDQLHRAPFRCPTPMIRSAQPRSKPHGRPRHEGLEWPDRG